jgi:hypothetical protein
MIHKQISLPEDLNQQITRRAKLLQEPEEQVIRDLLSLGLVKASRWRNSEEALRTLGELGIAGPADLAKQHDDESLPHQP